MNYGKAFRILRATFDLNQPQLSKLLGVGQSHVSLIETGRRQPSRNLIHALAAALRVPEPLIILLASEASDFERQDPMQIEALTRSLLRLLVSAPQTTVQPALPLVDAEDKQ